MTASHHLSSSAVAARNVAMPIGEVPVAAVMTHDVVCVTPDLSVDALRAILIERGITGVPVVDEQGMPIGMISSTDLVRNDYEHGDTEEQGPVRALDATDALERGLHVEPSRATVADYMLPVAHTVTEDAPVAHAAAIMAWERVHRLPVCSSDGDVVGIITTLDVVRWLADTAGYPARK